MRLLNRFVSMTALLFFSYSLVLFSHSGLLAYAQEPSPFEIHIIPQAEYAVSGQPLSYTVLVTNISQVAIQNALVRVKVPTGTVLVEALNTNPDWYSNNPPPGVIREEALWLTPNAVAPGEVLTFQMVVKPLPELAQQQIVNETYSVGVAAEGGSEIIATGIPIEIPLFTPTPAPSVTSTATVTSTIFVSLTPVFTPQEVIVTTASTPDATSVAGIDTDTPPVETGSTPAVTPPSASVDSPLFTYIFIGLVTVVFVGGLVWFLRKK